MENPILFKKHQKSANTSTIGFIILHKTHIYKWKINISINKITYAIIINTWNRMNIISILYIASFDGNLFVVDSQVSSKIFLMAIILLLESPLRNSVINCDTV